MATDKGKDKKHFPAAFWAVRAHLCREKIEYRNGSSLFLHGRRQLNCRARMEGESVSDGYGIIMPVSSFPLWGGQDEVKVSFSRFNLRGST